MKKVIISLLMFCLILCIVLLIFLNREKDNQENIELENDIIYSDKIEESVMEKRENLESYYILEQCVYAYLDSINVNNSSYYGYNKNNEYVKITDENNIIYNLLSKEYIGNNNIVAGNLDNYVDKLEKKVFYVPLKTKFIESDNLYKYAVYGYITDIYNEYIKDILIVVNLDFNNGTFSIEPVQENINIENIELDVNKLESIEENENNKFSYIQVNDETISSKYLDYYKKMLLSNVKEAYKRLDEEYKKNKFDSIEIFEDYINKNKSEILSASLKQYQVNEFDDYTQYICIDQNNNYYIFKETNFQEYTVILDTYTIDLPQFIDKYNSSTNSEKVLLNIQKIFSAINDGDYNYVYNKLDSTFKQNNFPTLDSFETYIKQNFYQNNSIGYSNYQTSGDLHIYEISITNSDDENSKVITKNFIMQLKDGTDFVMSFNV